MSYLMQCYDCFLISCVYSLCYEVFDFSKSQKPVSLGKSKIFVIFGKIREARGFGQIRSHQEMNGWERLKRRSSNVFNDYYTLSINFFLSFSLNQQTFMLYPKVPVSLSPCIGHRWKFLEGGWERIFGVCGYVENSRYLIKQSSPLPLWKNIAFIYLCILYENNTQLPVIGIA